MESFVSVGETFFKWYLMEILKKLQQPTSRQIFEKLLETNSVQKMPKSLCRPNTEPTVLDINALVH